jgi:DNA-binding response OmpR family regulator
MRVAEGNMFRILSVGNDSTLLQSRAALLGYTGAKVDSADVLNARSVAMLRRYELLILCQSVPMRDAMELHEICRFRNPQSRTLLLGADMREDAMEIDSDGRLNSLEGPTALINEVSGWMRRAS